MQYMTIHKCNTDVLRVLLIYPHSSSGAARPQDRACISVKPFAAVLQPINVCMHVCMHVCICYMYVCSYVCMYVRMCI